MSLALALVLASPAAAQTTEGTQVAQPPVQTGDYAYQLFVPRGYAAMPKQQWPLVIFLHGSGERGSDIERVKVNGPPKIVVNHPGSPFLMISPQLEEGGDWNQQTLERLLARIRKAYRVDPSRIYLTGLSRGGHGSWAWATARPDLFAALVPVAGRGDPAKACALKDMPVWALHGDNDDIVRPVGSFAVVEAIRACPGLTVQPRLTLYPATNHGSWEPAYDEDAVWRWMLEQRRAVPAR